MVKKIFLLNAMCLILCCSCVDKKTSEVTYEGGVMKISAPLLERKTTELPRITNLFKSIDTIYLAPTGDHTFMTSFEDIKIVDDTLFIMSNQSVFLYKKDGSFIRKLEGNRLFRKFDVSAKTKELYFLTSNSIYVYSFYGTFIKRISTDNDFLDDFAVMSDGGFILYNPASLPNGRRGVWKIDKNGVFEKQLITIDESYQHVIITERAFQHLDDQTVGLMGLEDNDYFYHITADSAYVVYQMTTDIVMTEETKQLAKAPGKATEYVKANYFENDCILYFTLADLKKRDQVRVIYNKCDDKIYRTYKEDFLKIADRTEAFPVNTSSYKGTFIYYYLASQIISDPMLKPAFPNVNLESYPVLFLAR